LFSSLRAERFLRPFFVFDREEEWLLFPCRIFFKGEIDMKNFFEAMQDHNHVSMAQRLILADNDIFNRPLTATEQEIKTIIEQVDAYSWSRGQSGGLFSGFSGFDEGLEGGIQPGVYLFAAQPNVGKSALLLQIAKQVAESNERVFVVYFSLDDSLNELLPRFIACDQRITIGQAKNPEKYTDDPLVMERRNRGLEKLYRMVDRFGMYDAGIVGSSIESMEQKIKELKLSLPEDTRMMVCIDNFYDITSDHRAHQSDDSAKYEYHASEIKRWYKQYNIPVLCTAELRKLNSNRRPTPEDLRDTVKLSYVANWIGLLYNEVGIREDGAQLYWLSDDVDQKMPVIELRFGKNKLGSFKGTKFLSLFLICHYVWSQQMKIANDMHPYCTDKELTNHDNQYKRTVFRK